ncbi:hypothetical protein [Cucumibacter marinus]|uniref:hypothetical protein n=1 Tax=Cucumibacter marinus TaxID=1121252 RepID=UPI00040CB9CF|nr:hypothetical protein [Cucumibacter marinus]
MSKSLTPTAFDRMVNQSPKDRVIWTLGAIAQRIGTGPDFVRTLACQPGSPIHRVGGRYCVLESDLIEFLRRGH